jgi:CubicO group peptidase (beta-lactamase class C family)
MMLHHVIFLFCLAGQIGPASAPPRVDPVKLKALVEAAKEADTTAMMIVKDGETVGEWHFDSDDRPIELMSATKSVVALAVGKLMEQGAITSLDQPMSDFFPEWKQGRKRQISIRHILTHTSCLQNEPTTLTEIYPSPDFVQLALAAELVCDPGSEFCYNNKAVNLLSALVARASGMPLDVYVNTFIFMPLGITQYEWQRDNAGTPSAMSGLGLRVADMARVGQLVLQEGMWEGKPVLPSAFIKSLREPGHPTTPHHGLLWWTNATLETPHPTDFRMGALGYLGQYLIINPQKRLVAVRLAAPKNDQFDEDKITFAEFGKLLREL